jgi:hypothetical protein
MKIPNTIQHPTRGRLVCKIYDNGGETLDRYTVTFKAFHISGYGLCYRYISASDEPFHPLGFGQHGENRTSIDGKHLGNRVMFARLPSGVQKFIMQSI